MCELDRSGSCPLPYPFSTSFRSGTGSSAREALRRTVELAQLAERLGYVRYWFAEHHGMPSVASAAPELLIAHVAATVTLRVGSGGVMLPNHAPLRIAEAYRTLEALHPGRIDLGIGRAPGSDAHAAGLARGRWRALPRPAVGAVEPSPA